MFVPAFIVQDGDTGLFLCPSEDGDVSYCKLITEAGTFDNQQSALDTAIDYIDPPYIVLFPFFREI
ncbi:hypothetical protein [Chitinimonas koreensis]|uniref:hypothetical protein n=1 Tax=Chitinimonas koreensis TaxID=356302 RepID=UPI00042604E5|nr:hypothetical protein [Chitinimonas koreensis]QNM98686.1 hypothetical protein H9L41_10950 [Chitinimonas koreensis]